MLTLRVVSEPEQGLAQNATKRFFGGTGSIGRGPGNDWVLPDPERLVSGRHALVEFDGDCYYLTDNSTNGTSVNRRDNLVGRGRRVALNDGDRVYLGDYVIEARIEAEGAFTTAQEIEDTSGLHDDRFTLEFDWPDDNEPTETQGHAPDHFSADRDGSMGTQHDHIPTHMEQFEPPAAYREQIPSDWEEETPCCGAGHAFRGGEGILPVAEPRERSLSEETLAATTPPPAYQRPAEPPAPLGDPAVSATAGEQRQTAAAEQAVPRGPDPVAAFLEGAGLGDTALTAEATTDLMRMVGEVFREVVKGMRETLMARAEFKRGFRVQQTVIMPVENNPLKFTVGDVEETMRTLLLRQGSGYMPALEAVREGFQDIQDHQLGVVVGMKAGLQLLLRRFDPAALERQFEERGGRSHVLPMGKKTKLWDQYLRLYQALDQEIEDDFQAVFGNEFVSAYEKQVQALGETREADRPIPTSATR